jgi:hypothetical protein
MCRTGELATPARVMATSDSTEKLARRFTTIGLENRLNTRSCSRKGLRHCVGYAGAVPVPVGVLAAAASPASGARCDRVSPVGAKRV